MKFVLITGCPRSGTTPLVSWLGTSPNVLALCESRRTLTIHRFMEEAKRFKSTAGELSDIKSHLRDLTRRWYDTSTALIVDKEPIEPIAFPVRDYAEYLNNIVDVLGAKLVFVIREPVMTVHEIVSRQWGFSRVEENLERRTDSQAVRMWREATEIALQYAGRENVRLQSYEQLVADPQHQSIAICDFVGATLPQTEFPAKTIRHQISPEFKAYVENETFGLYSLVKAALATESEAR